MTSGKEDILLRKWTKGDIGHFYIIRGNDNEEGIANLSISILKRELMITGDEARSKWSHGHPDITKLIPDNDRGYLLGDGSLDAFFNVHNYRPIELSRHIIVVYQAHTIDEAYANKMLKTLEEPGPYSTTFFIPSGRLRMLPTIESRAITIFLGREKTEESLSVDPSIVDLLIAYCNESDGKHKFFEKIKSSPEQEHAVYSLLLDYICSTDDISERPTQLYQELKHFERSRSFNNEVQARFFSLLHELTRNNRGRQLANFVLKYKNGCQRESQEVRGHSAAR